MLTARSISAAKIGFSVEDVTFASELAMLLASAILSVSFNSLKDVVRFET